MIELKTKNEVAVALWVVLGALNDAQSSQSAHCALGGVPNGHLYAQLMGEFDIETWTKLVELGKAQGLWTEQHYLLKITEKGREMFVKLDEVLGKKVEVASV